MNWKERWPIIFLIIGTVGILIGMQYNVNYMAENNVNKEVIKSEIETEDEEVVEEIITEEKNEIKIHGRCFDEQKYLDSSIKVADYIRSFDIYHYRTDIYKSSIAYELHIYKNEVNKEELKNDLIEMCNGIKDIWYQNGYDEDIYLIITDANNIDIVLMLVDDGQITLDNL